MTLRLAAAALSLTALLGACRVIPAPGPRETRYVPRARAVTITTVPLLTKEMQTIYPFLRADFARGGVLEGKEVYAFSPATITVVAGDTIHLALINPEDDVHSFVLPDLLVSLPGQSRRDTTYVAARPGIYDFTCSVPSHVPMMHGTLVVLAPEALGFTTGEPVAR